MHQLMECQQETYNAKMSIEVYHNATLFVGVENILDTQYRTFSSGINAQEGIYELRYNFKKLYSLK
jgi:hemoglobin/transferrin/lactoferrin receptor protein